MSGFDSYVSRAKDGHVFSEEDMTECITILMRGDATDEQAASFLSALHERGETAAEISGAARALRSLASTIDAPKGAIDCCGTGGDGLSTYNISTAVALVAASCGVTIAKHGNRSATSSSGAADVLEHLGVTLNLSEPTLERALKDLHFCFLMAPNHHKAMKNVSAVRKSLGHRTIFNLLGPLANPARTKKQLIGVYDKRWVRPVAEALLSLGTERALVVHGADGLDEITLTGPTHVAYLNNGIITENVFLPADFGLPTITIANIRGGGVEENAGALIGVLNGNHNAYRAMVLANTAAVLTLHDDTPFHKGVQIAANAIDTGRAFALLNHYKELCA